MIETSVIGIGTAVVILVFIGTLIYNISMFQTTTKDRLDALEDDHNKSAEEIAEIRKNESMIRVTLAKMEATLEYIRVKIDNK